jgi:rRNA maturation RNase YbeY
MIEVQIDGAADDEHARRIEGGVRAALDARSIERAEVSVALIDDASIQALNRDHLGHDRPTDVIAFPLWTEGDPLVVGDVYVGRDQARRQAADEGIDWREEVVRLAIHGTLHVTGMDHPEAAEDRPMSEMYRLQEQLMQAATAVDAIIIGTGQAGKPLAGALAEAGWRTIIVERAERVGGTCVIEGCTPTKTMVASARVAHLARRAADYGVEVGQVSVDLEVVRRRKRDIVEAWSSGSKNGMQRHQTLELVFGEARFSGPREVTIALSDGGRRTCRAPYIFINTGTHTQIPEIPGLDGVPYLTSTSIMELGEVPEHLIVLGGGYIGLEFGQMFRRFGSRVSVLEAGPRLLGREDDDVADEVTTILEGEGLDIVVNAKASRVMPGEVGVSGASGGAGVSVEIDTPEGRRVVSGSHLLVSVGRRPSSDLDLEMTGLSANERGFIPVDDRLQTEVEGIFALGDVNGGPPFTHVAYDDYRVVRDNLLGAGGSSRAGRLVPYTLFIDPQLGRVGLSESEARRQGLDVRIFKLPMSRVARATETDETRGFMKAVVDAADGRILGATVLGIEGGEITAALQIAMMGGLPYTALREGVFAHPTLTESLNNLFMTLD